MKIETITEMCGIPAGLITTVDEAIGKELIEQGIAVEITDEEFDSKEEIEPPTEPVKEDEPIVEEPVKEVVEKSKK